MPSSENRVAGAEMAMIDISLISLKKKLEQERALIPLVAQVWEVPVQGQDNGSTIALIIQHMQNAHAARSVWEALSPHERLCLFYLFGSGNPDKHKGITLESLRKKTKLSSEIVEEAVESLRARWCLVDTGIIPISSPARNSPYRLGPALERGVFPYRECFQQLWQIGLETLQTDENRSNFSLAQLINTFSADRLRYLANLCHIPMYFGVYPYNVYASSASSAPLLKEFQERISEVLCHPLISFDLLHQLEPLAQEVFFWLCEQGGKVKMAEVRSYIATRIRTGVNPVPTGALLTVLTALEAHALAFDTFTSDGTRWLFIPTDLQERVKHEIQDRAEDEQRFALRPLEDTPISQESQPLLLYDLAIAIGMSMQMIIEPTKEGRLPKRLRGKIRPFLHGCARVGDASDDLYVDQVFRTAQKMELIACASPTEEEKRRYLRGPKLDAWSELSLIEQAQALLTWWKETSLWVDVRSDGKLLYSSSAVHHQLLHHLKQCIPDRWYRTDALLYAIFRQAPISLFDPYTRKPIKPTPLSIRREQWMEREAETHIGPLASFLSELGIVSVRQQSPALEEGPDLFCVTSFGAAVLQAIPASSDTPAQAAGQPALILQPNYEVLVMQFDTKLVYQLLSIAELVRIGIVSTFRLTESALLTGLTSGVRLEHILTFLATHTPQKELPQNVAYTIKDWAKSYREFRLAEVLLLETPENETLEGLHRLLGNLPIELRHVGPGSFLVLPKAQVPFGELRKRLRQAGIVVRGEPSGASGKRS
jgi:Helicase conserved C-terminal domain